MIHYVRFGVLALLAACKGTENARATTTPDSARMSAAAAPATPVATSALDDKASDPIVARADSGRIRGNASSKVWMIIASDFQCPYCKMWHDSADMTIRSEYVDNGKVRLAFVNFPLGNHQNALPAAEYAMCGAAQNKFWEVHDRLFEAQEQWAQQSNPTAVLENAATAGGADLTQLRACVSSQKMRPLIEADREKASRAGVRATPSFFIGNQILEGVQMPSDLRKVLDAAIAAAR